MTGDTLFPIETNANKSNPTVPASRRTDPETSRQAAKAVQRHKSTHRSKVLEAIRAHPGLTACELAARIDGLDRYQVSRTTAELEHAALVRKGDARACRIKGTNQTTWFAQD